MLKLVDFKATRLILWFNIVFIFYCINKNRYAEKFSLHLHVATTFAFVVVGGEDGCSRNNYKIILNKYREHMYVGKYCEIHKHSKIHYPFQLKTQYIFPLCKTKDTMNEE